MVSSAGRRSAQRPIICMTVRSSAGVRGLMNMVVQLATEAHLNEDEPVLIQRPVSL